MKKILSFVILSAFSILLIAGSVSAQMIKDTDKPGGLQDMTQTVATTANFSNVTIGYIVGNIIKVALGFLATIFLALTVVAGFQWMTASGNEDQVKKAQTSMRNAIIGLVLVLASYAITYFIFKYLPFSGGSTGIQGGTGG